MKLFTKYSRINLVATITIFLVASTAFYFTLRLVFIHQIDEDLKIEQKEIETFVKEHNRLPESISVNDQLIHFEPWSANTQRQFTTKMMIEPGDHKKENFRHFVFGIQAANRWYRITVSKSLKETEKLTESILIIVFTTILVILLVSFIINRFVLKRIWRPFYRSLDRAKEFKVGGARPLQLGVSAINEFQLMNETLGRITSQAQLDYLSLKTFSENASHEIQTPLAVIRSKLDLMIQDEHLTEKQSGLLQAAYNAVQKLTKLNQSLLLLAKIENRQFHKTKSINLKNKIEEKISDFQELWMAQEFIIQTELKDVTISMNEELLEILLNNLLSNATKHNFRGGKINIVLNENYLAVANTSYIGPLDPDKLYQRFNKLSNQQESTGLGLSIIKQICRTSGLKINYQFTGDLHFFKVSRQPIAVFQS
jgi:signal transduction histidine kinase